MLFTLIIGKLAIKIAGLANKDIGIAGKLALKINKDILKRLKKKISGEFIFIIGTNGKTTTRKLLVEIFGKEKLNIGNNHHSKDDYNGIISALIEKIRIFGKTKVDYMVIEIKDIATLSLFTEIKPEYLIITNLFEEQLSRKGNFKEKINKLKIYLSTLSETTMIFNGDDPVVVDIGMDLKNRLVYYGIDNKDEEDEAEEKKCIRCGGVLKYTYIDAGQLGDYTCQNCDLERPEIDYLATNVSLKDGIYFDLWTKGEEYPFDLPSQGYHNIYNLLAALALLDELDIGIDAGELALEEFEFEDNEVDTFYIKKPIFLKESDNIASFEQSLETLDEDEGKIDILFFFGEEKYEEDITFIYDCDFSVLEKTNIGKIYITGMRAFDLALAIRYMTNASKKIIVEDNEISLLSHAINGKAEKLYIVAKGDNDINLEKKLITMEKKWSKNKLWIGK